MPVHRDRPAFPVVPRWIGHRKGTVAFWSVALARWVGNGHSSLFEALEGRSWTASVAAVAVCRCCTAGSRRGLVWNGNCWRSCSPETMRRPWLPWPPSAAALPASSGTGLPPPSRLPRSMSVGSGTRAGRALRRWGSNETGGATTRELMHRMGRSSVRAALIYQHLVNGRDQAIADHVDEQIRCSKPDRGGPDGPSGT